MTDIATTTDVKHPYIVRQQNICRGKPTIKGTRIKVSQIVTEFERLGWTADQIVDAHPHLTLTQVHAALAYYYDHADEINRELREREEFIREMEKNRSRSVLEEKRRGASNLHG